MSRPAHVRMKMDRGVDETQSRAFGLALATLRSPRSFSAMLYTVRVKGIVTRIFTRTWPRQQ